MTAEDWVVILARGASSRMGFPKGLCRLPGDSLCFLARIARTHHEVGHAVAIATTGNLHREYAEMLDHDPPVHWILGEAGRGTGDTVAAAAQELAGRAKRLWLHPVDLPLITPPLLRELRGKAWQHPEAAIVPAHDGHPGHPVILPTPFLVSLREHAPAGSLRDWLLSVTISGGRDRIGRLVTVPVADRAVVTDFDHPPENNDPVKEEK